MWREISPDRSLIPPPAAGRTCSWEFRRGSPIATEPDLQKRFKELAQGENVFVGRVPSQNDLSALFTVRATMLYLRSGGRLAFVLPMAALTRGQFELFRRGSFQTSRIGWDAAWVMNDDVQPLFPVPSCVVFGRRTALSQAAPDKVRVYSGTLPYRDAPEEVADKNLKVKENAPALKPPSTRADRHTVAYSETAQPCSLECSCSLSENRWVASVLTPVRR